MPARNSPYGRVKVNILNLQKKIQISRLISSDIKKAAREAMASQMQINGSAALTIDTEPRQRRGGCIKNGWINICLCDDKTIRAFNRNYFSKDCPTDVIAFNIAKPGQKGGFLADIIVSTDTVISNSGIFKTAPLYELFFCVIHGILHVLGYEDDTEKKRLIMHKKQRQICRKFFKHE